MSVPQGFDAREAPVIREPSRSVKAGAVVALKAAAAASCLALIAPALSGCGQEDEGFHPPVQHAGAAISESDYIAHVSALALAVEEGLYGEAAAARAASSEEGSPRVRRSSASRIT